MVFAAIEEKGLGKIAQFAVNPGAESLLIELVEQVFELALASANDWSHHRHALAAAQFENACHDLVCGLSGNRSAAIGAMWSAYRSIEQAQIVIDFGDRADRGSRAAACGLLLDRDGWRQAFNGINIGPLNLIEELSA